MESLRQNYDLVVVGGGPAGCSAAITGARAGARVLLLERGTYPRHKVCGEFISPESLSLLSWLLHKEELDLIQTSITLSEARLFVDGHTIRVPIRQAAVSLSRRDLDLALWNAAQHSGVQAVLQTAVHNIRGSGPFLVETSAGSITCRAVINASGRWSNLHNFGPLRNSAWLGLKTHMRGESAATVDLYFFDGGYCGVQPVRGAGGEVLVNVCALLQGSGTLRLEDVLACHPELAARSRPWETAFPQLSTYPVIFREPKPTTDNFLNVGDAAGFVDPFLGDGIALALRGGHMAADALHPFLDGTCDLFIAKRRYAHEYDRALRPVYRKSSLLRGLVSLPKCVRAPLLKFAEMAPGMTARLMQGTRSREVEGIA